VFGPRVAPPTVAFWRRVRDDAVVSQLHAMAASALVALVASHLAVSAWLALRRSAPAWRDPLARAVVGLLVVEGALGLVLYAGGARPVAGIHVFYGLAVVAVPAVAATFAGEAPPRAHGIVMSVAGAITLGLLWRLIGTG
jgi:hypothetical protein